MSRRAHRVSGLLPGVAGSLVLGAWLLVGCGGSGGEAGDPSAAEPTPAPAPTAVPATPTEPPCDVEYESTFGAIEEIVFARHGCTDASCHGAALAGGLDLRRGGSWANLVDIPAVGKSEVLVVPGDKDRSYLFAKLLAKLEPGVLAVNGAPMPVGPTALSPEELELVRLWIVGGAPEATTVDGTAELLDACLPEPLPVRIEALSEPAVDEGIQFVLAPIELPAGTEQEYCFAIYFDYSDQVPDEFKDPSGEFFYVSGQELRQDPMSHHLVFFYAPDLGPEDLDDPVFQGWTCAGGTRDGQECDPGAKDSCDGAICRSKPQPSFACLGFGPGGIDPIGGQLAGAQESNAYLELDPGVYGKLPLKGVAYVNTHGFNLTAEDHVLNGRVNIYFAEDRRFPVVPLIAGTATFSPATAPYEIEEVCSSIVLPQGSRLFAMSSHNHKRGKLFWAELPDGTRIYESTTYSDPTKQRFSPPLEFDSAASRERRIRYCAVFNNGVDAAGNPDPEEVTRASRIPAGAVANGSGCEPIACVAGRVGEPCQTDDDCHSRPGASDGWCDACAIKGGISTENEMFILLGQQYIAEGYPQPDIDGMVSSGVASVRP